MTDDRVSGARVRRVVLAWSGGAGSAAMIAALASRPDVEIVTLTIDLGEGGALVDVRDRARGGGAVRAHVIDGRDELARDFLLPAVQAGALHEAGPSLLRPLTHALIAKHLVSIVKLERATVVARGARHVTALPTALDHAIRDLDRSIAIWNPSVLPETIHAGGPASSALPLVERVAHASWLERRPGAVDLPGDRALVDLQFDGGEPTSVNGVRMPLVDLCRILETIARAHGAAPGDARREPAIDAAAVVLLDAAHRALLARASLDPPASSCAVAYARCVEQGRWFTAARRAMALEISTAQRRVNGRVSLALYRGGFHVVDVEVSPPKVRARREDDPASHPSPLPVPSSSPADHSTSGRSRG